jgi:hypothetical protein
MLEEYDFKDGIIGKYAKEYAQGSNVVVIDPDVAKYFHDHDSVNEALRSILPIVKRITAQSCKDEKQAEKI